MNEVDDIVELLNSMLNQQNDKADTYLKLLERLKSEFNLKFILIDLEKYNDAKMNEYRQKKLEVANKRDFESAAWYRTLEDQCKEYIDLKNSLNITSSTFIKDDALLFYFYFGQSQAEGITRDAFLSQTNIN
jgi:hypothetical protein